MGRQAVAVHAHTANRMVAVAIVLMVLVFLFLVSRTFSDGSTARAVVVAPSERAVAERAHPADTDSDNDGLLDWEEDLWGTDRNDPDSDNDGVPDGAERSGLGTTGTQAADPDRFALSVDAAEDLTATEVVARELFGAYLQNFTEDPNVTPEKQEAIVENALASLMDRVEAPAFTRSNVPGTLPSTEESRARYIESVKNALRAVNSQAPAEYTALLDLAQGREQAGSAALVHAATAYRTGADTLAKLSVPEDIVEEHIRLVDALYRYAISLEQVTAMETDPALVVVGISLFTAAQEDLSTATNELMRYSGFNPTGIVMPPTQNTTPGTPVNTTNVTP